MLPILFSGFEIASTFEEGSHLLDRLRVIQAKFSGLPERLKHPSML
jgi:hypothetical protein